MTIWVIVNNIIAIAGYALVRFKFGDVGDNWRNSQSHWEKRTKFFLQDEINRSTFRQIASVIP